MYGASSGQRGMTTSSGLRRSSRGYAAARAGSAWSSRAARSRSQVGLEQADQLVDLLAAIFAPHGKGVAHARLEVRGEEQLRYLRESGPGSAHLHDDVDAVAVLLDHLLDAADLTRDALEASDNIVFACTVHLLSWAAGGSVPGMGMT